MTTQASTPRVATTSDGYKFTEQGDGTWSDGDMTFDSINDLFEQDPQLTIDGKIYSEKAWRDEEAQKGDADGSQPGPY